MQALTSILRKKLVLAVIAATAVGSGAYAFAATLGVSSSTLGAGNTTVVSCAASIAANYTAAFDNTVTGHYRVDTVTLTIPVGATCAEGDHLSITLEGASSAELKTFAYDLQSADLPTTNPGTVTFSSGTSPFDGSGTPVSANALQGISVAAAGQ